MLEILGTIAGNILSLPGIVGRALGMTTRNLALAAILGALIGVLETYIFTGFGDPKELVIAVCVGVVAGCVGRAIRVRGATV